MAFKLIRVALVSVFYATFAMAHMKMTDPIPLGSPNLAGVKSPDYTLVAPLGPIVAGGIGSYPCKGYHKDGSSPLTSQKTVAAGSPFTFTIGGGAIHEGGSCQVSISSDQGASWSVIQSHIGGCLTDSLSETITIPKDTPNGDVLFSWTWFNHQGGRGEMYNNCAVISITGGGSGLSDKKKYPEPFVANTDQNSCETTPGTDVVFPEPGIQVVYGGTYKGETPAAGAGIKGTNCVAKGSTAGSGGSAPAASSDPATVPSGPAAAPSGSSAATPAGPAAPPTTPAPASSSSSSSAASSSASSPSSSVAAAGAPAASPPAVAAPATPPKACKKKRSRVPTADVQGHGHVDRRHERLVRRSTGRLAAQPAVHLSP